MKNSLLSHIKEQIKLGKKLFAVLVDPDKTNEENCLKLTQYKGIDLFLVGGSLLTKDNTQLTVNTLKKHSDKPVLLFPGNSNQVVEEADGLLFLSLISGRNPDALIGQHVAMAPILHHMNLEIIPTGYMLIDSGKSTTALYMSQTMPIPANKPEIAMATALAGQMLGLQLIYMDGGSGASQPISAEMIREVKEKLSIPLIIGGGINTTEKAKLAYESGADMIVVGNKIEEHPDFINEIVRLKG